MEDNEDAALFFCVISPWQNIYVRAITPEP